jgi:hypothetical protein
MPNQIDNTIINFNNPQKQIKVRNLKIGDEVLVYIHRSNGGSSSGPDVEGKEEYKVWVIFAGFLLNKNMGNTYYQDGTPTGHILHDSDIFGYKKGTGLAVIEKVFKENARDIGNWAVRDYINVFKKSPFKQGEKIRVLRNIEQINKDANIKTDKKLIKATDLEYVDFDKKNNTVTIQSKSLKKVGTTSVYSIIPESKLLLKNIYKKIILENISLPNLDLSYQVPQNQLYRWITPSELFERIKNGTFKESIVTELAKDDYGKTYKIRGIPFFTNPRKWFGYESTPFMRIILDKQKLLKDGYKIVDPHFDPFEVRVLGNIKNFLKYLIVAEVNIDEFKEEGDERREFPLSKPDKIIVWKLINKIFPKNKIKFVDDNWYEKRID